MHSDSKRLDVITYKHERDASREELIVTQANSWCQQESCCMMLHIFEADKTPLGGLPVDKSAIMDVSMCESNERSWYVVCKFYSFNSRDLTIIRCNQDVSDITAVRHFVLAFPT